MIHLIRHGKAGSRPDWAQPDDLRPLTEAGRRQATALADQLGGTDVKCVLTSRYTRCVQTVEPLAARLGIEVEAHPALAEEADLAATWKLLKALATTESALCTHGNVLDAMIERLHRKGVELVGRRGSGRKASVWSVEADAAGGFVRAVHTPPPAT